MSQKAIPPERPEWATLSPQVQKEELHLKNHIESTKTDHNIHSCAFQVRSQE